MGKNYIWIPRIIIIIFIFLMGLLSLDVFDMKGSFTEKICGFLVHNIPTLILIFSLIFTWNRRRAGGIIFIIIGAAFTVFFGTHRRIDTFFLISAPLFLSGILFLLQDRNTKKDLSGLK